MDQKQSYSPNDKRWFTVLFPALQVHSLFPHLSFFTWKTQFFLTFFCSLGRFSTFFTDDADDAAAAGDDDDDDDRGQTEQKIWSSWQTLCSKWLDELLTVGIDL